MANTLAASPLGVPLRALTAFWAAIAQGMRMLVIFPAVKQMYAPAMPIIGKYITGSITQVHTSWANSAPNTAATVLQPGKLL